MSNRAHPTWRAK
uniref:Uncharacterized protein n=1 Tax=Arundo donax TaxID=35708 RepID=A0A0A9A9C4_ARUDO